MNLDISNQNTTKYLKQKIRNKQKQNQKQIKNGQIYERRTKLPYRTSSLSLTGLRSRSTKHKETTAAVKRGRHEQGENQKEGAHKPSLIYEDP